jgi:hypothetical protein
LKTLWKATTYIDGCEEPIEAVLIEHGKIQKADEMAKAAIQAVEYQERFQIDNLITKAFEWPS